MLRVSAFNVEEQTDRQLVVPKNSETLVGLVDCYLELDQLENAQAVVQEGLRIFGSSDIDFSGFAEAIRDRKAAQ